MRITPVMVNGIYDGFRDAQAEYGTPLWNTIRQDEPDLGSILGITDDLQWLDEEGFLA